MNSNKKKIDEKVNVVKLYDKVSVNSDALDLTDNSAYGRERGSGDEQL